MGGIASMMPLTWIFMIIGTLALTGVGIPGTSIGFAGFFSKDAIIEGAWEAGIAGTAFGFPAFWVGVIAALLTSFYSWRVVFMTFHGSYRGDPKVLSHAHESPPLMLVPLGLLSIGAVFAGLIFASSFIGDKAPEFWRSPAMAETVAASPAIAGHDGAAITHEAASTDKAEPAAAHEEGGEHAVPLWVAWSPFAVTLIGFLVAWYMYITRPGLGARMAARSSLVHPFLYNKWYVDEIYDFVFIRGARKLGDLFWKIGDQRLIDGFGPNGFAAATLAGAKRIIRLQTGYLYHYAFAMLIGLVGFVTWLLFNGPGGH